MVSGGHKLSQRRQCALLRLTRSNLYYRPVGESAENLRFMEIINKQFLETPSSTHAGLTPSEAYETGREEEKLAA